jgi:ParB family chromosome partitioning protein
MNLSISLIDQPAENVRRIAASDSDDQALARSITALGVLQPILVQPIGDRYRLVDGARRLRAASRAGLSEIPAAFAVAAEAGWTTAAASAANMVRAAMAPLDQWRAMKRLQEQGYTLPGASAALGMTERSGKRLDRLSRLHPDVLAALEVGEWPDDDELAVVAMAPPERQAEALKTANHGSHIDWWRMREACTDKTVPASRAIFDIATSGLDFEEDLFAPADEQESYTRDRAGFMQAQRAALEERIKHPPKGVTYRLAETTKTGMVKDPPGAEREWSGDPTKPKRGRIVVWEILEGHNFGDVRGYVYNVPKVGKPASAASTPEEPSEDDPDIDMTDDEIDAREDAELAARAAAPKPLGITKAGEAIIAAMKTDALRASLRNATTRPPARELAPLLVLLLTSAPNVTVRGAEEPEDAVAGPTLDGLAPYLVNPAGDALDNDVSVANIEEVVAETLARCLSCATPDVERNGYRKDAGQVAEWIGRFVDASANLGRFDTPDFLATCSAAVLREAAASAGIKPVAKVTELRAQLAGKLPDWRPAAAAFGAPGPRRAA